MREFGADDSPTGCHIPDQGCGSLYNMPPSVMRNPSSEEKGKASGLLPTRFIITAVIVLGIAILGSAIFTFTTLQRLRTTYLSNSGRGIAAAIQAQARGPGRRNNPAFWQTLLESSYAAHSGSVAFLALVDQSGNLLAYKGSLQAGSIARNSTSDVYSFEEPLAPPRNPHNEASPIAAGWRIRIGLYTSETNFIQRQALLQLAISGLAVIALLVLSAGLARMLNRFLELKVREGAEAQLKSLGVMAASLAHEIRNPLGAIKGLTQLAQEDLPPDHAAQPQLRTVVSEAERLERLVTDLLDFARTKEPQISEFDLISLLSNIKTMLQSRLESSKVELRLSANTNPLNVRSDPAGLRQVLLNVLMNAIDATPEKGAVELTAGRDESHKSIFIQVDDSGKGLGRNKPDELFQPFVTTKARGTGLGLAVSKQIIDDLGGSLRLEDSPRGGARCSITLPMV
jgi:signal transduction histidine kinase